MVSLDEKGGLEWLEKVVTEDTMRDIFHAVSVARDTYTLKRPDEDSRMKLMVKGSTEFPTSEFSLKVSFDGNMPHRLVKEVLEECAFGVMQAWQNAMIGGPVLLESILIDVEALAWMPGVYRVDVFVGIVDHWMD